MATMFNLFSKCLRLSNDVHLKQVTVLRVLPSWGIVLRILAQIGEMERMKTSRIGLESNLEPKKWIPTIMLQFR